MSNQALSDLKVLEFGNLVSAPYCTKLLANLGAEVIKVEKPDFGDDARQRGPFYNDNPHPERSLLFLYLNTDKMSITLDPSKTIGRKIFMELIKDADILVENYSPKDMEKMKLDYESLKEINKNLIVTSITPFGWTGPYRDYKAYDLNSFHSGGLGYITPSASRYPDREPLTIGGGAQAGYQGALHAAYATMAAVSILQATGLAQHVDVSLQEIVTSIGGGWDAPLAYLSYMGSLMTRFTASGAMRGAEPCKDGYIMTMIASDKDWQAFTRLMGNPDWAKDDKFKDVFNRILNAEEMSLHVTEWLKDQEMEETYIKAQDLGLPFAPAYTPGDVIHSRQLKARDFWTELDHPETGRLKYAGAPYKMEKTPWQTNRAAPVLGEHNGMIYCERLGYKKQDMVRLRQAGII